MQKQIRRIQLTMLFTFAAQEERIKSSDEK